MIVDRLLQWDHDKATISLQIANKFAPFKIILKTKDEPDRLKAWIKHHAKIVGVENLIILDNMSSNEAVLDTYSEYENQITIFRFKGFHNRPHNTFDFPELYSALRESCDYFSFLDTDEYLTLYNGADIFQCGPEIVAFLNENKETHVFPGTWLQNLTGHGDRFMLWRPNGPLENGLKWGKPIISTRSHFSGTINHNTQIDHSLYTENLATNFFVLHRDRLSTAERIQANLRKLVSYGAIKPEDGVDNILARDIKSFSDGNAQHYYSEIKNLTTASTQPPPDISWWFGIGADGNARWNADWQRAEIQNFLVNPEQYSESLLST